jgi:hypothetical protein
MSGDPCNQEKRLEALERRHDALLESLKKMEDKFDAKLDMIIFQINKVAVLEEKHTYQSQALGRAFEKLGMLETSVDTLDKFRAHIEGMAKMAWVIWSAMGLSLAAIIAKLYGH